MLRALQPALVVVMETEIWPNVTRLSKARGMSLILANGRIYARNAAGQMVCVSVN